MCFPWYTLTSASENKTQSSPMSTVVVMKILDSTRKTPFPLYHILRFFMFFFQPNVSSTGAQNGHMVAYLLTTLAVDTYSLDLPNAYSGI